MWNRAAGETVVGRSSEMRAFADGAERNEGAIGQLGSRCQA